MICPIGGGLAPESLKAEKSKNWTIGAVWEPTRNVTLGLDYWDVRLKDTIGQLPEQAIFGDPVKYANRFVRCGAVTPANLANPQIAATCFDPITGALQPGVLGVAVQVDSGGRISPQLGRAGLAVQSASVPWMIAPCTVMRPVPVTAA